MADATDRLTDQEIDDMILLLQAKEEMPLDSDGQASSEVANRKAATGTSGDAQPIVDLSSLARSFRHLADCESRMAEIRATAAQEVERWTQWEEDETEQDRRQAAFHRANIERFAVDWIAARKVRGKTVTTPFGQVELTTRQPQPEIADADVLYLWAAHQGFLRDPKINEPTIDWAALKKAGQVVDGEFRFRGEPVPGVRIKPETTSAEISAWA